MASKGKKSTQGPDPEVYKKLFQELDKDKNGFLSYAEFDQLLVKAGSKLPESAKKQFFQFFDGPEGDSRITLQEFTRGLDQIVKLVEEAKTIFREFDKSGDGFLDRNETRQMVNQMMGDKPVTDKELDQIVQAADVNKDNKISLSEFIAAFF